MKWTKRKCFATETDLYMALLHIRSTLIGSNLSCVVTILLNRPARGLLQKLSRPPIVFNKYENIHAALIKRKPHTSVDIDTHENIKFLPTNERYHKWAASSEGPPGMSACSN